MRAQPSEKQKVGLCFRPWSDRRPLRSGLTAQLCSPAWPWLCSEGGPAVEDQQEATHRMGRDRSVPAASERWRRKAGHYRALSGPPTREL